METVIVGLALLALLIGLLFVALLSLFRLLLPRSNKTVSLPDAAQTRVEAAAPVTSEAASEQPAQSPPIVRTATKRKALSEIDIRPLIDSLPEAKVTWVTDGDTVNVQVGRAIKTIRLDSIDCPEDGQEWGEEARNGLIRLVGRKTVRLEAFGCDDYGRTLATLYVMHPARKVWMNVNERMVTLGHAWVMHRYYDHLPPDRQDRLNRLESWARAKKMGLWQVPCPTPPWLWRRNKRAEESSAEVDPGASQQSALNRGMHSSI